MNKTECALADKLIAELPIKDVTVTISKGFWSHAHQDCCRWEAAFTFADTKLSAVTQCWDSPRACLRKKARLAFKAGSQYQPDEIEIVT